METQKVASVPSMAEPAHSLFPAGQIVPFILVTALFFLWGIPNNLNDVLIRHFMKSFVISRFQAGLVQSAFYMGYFLLAIPAGLMMKRVGYKAGFVVGLLLFAAGAFLFWPAAVTSSYGFFLFALFVIASGLSFLETASNPFIAQLGDPESSERRLNFSQAFNPLGAITGALVGTVFIFSGVELSPGQVASQKAARTYDAYLRSETLRVVRPYLVIGAIAVIWAVLILRTELEASANSCTKAISCWLSLHSFFMSERKSGPGAISSRMFKNMRTSQKKPRDIFSPERWRPSVLAASLPLI
jgi:FHS family L-fucose permease-like MFS transporter